MTEDQAAEQVAPVEELSHSAAMQANTIIGDHDKKHNISREEEEGEEQQPEPPPTPAPTVMINTTTADHDHNNHNPVTILPPINNNNEFSTTGVTTAPATTNNNNSHQESSSSHNRHVSFDLPPNAHIKKNRLFGRQKPVHTVLGGGRPADVILWRNKQISASMLAASTVIWLLFEWIGYHVLTFICHSLILTLAALFLWSNLSSFLNTSPPVFPEIALPEDLTTRIALLSRDRVNKAFLLFRDVASGKDLKKFFYVILGLWVASIVGGWFNFLTLVYIISVVVLTVPLLYEMHEDQVDTYAEKATGEIKKRYNALDDKVLQKLPKIPFMKDTKQH